MTDASDCFVRTAETLNTVRIFFSRRVSHYKFEELQNCLIIEKTFLLHKFTHEIQDYLVPSARSDFELGHGNETAI